MSRPSRITGIVCSCTGIIYVEIHILKTVEDFILQVSSSKRIKRNFYLNFSLLMHGPK